MFSHSILAVALATTWFVGGHFLLSHPLRRPIEERLGPQGFRGLYTVVAAIGLAWMIYAYSTAPHVEWWGDPRWARHLLLLVMLFAVFFLVVGMTTPSPGVVGAERVRMDYANGLGIHAITRHPGLWGFGLWALGHMIANGDAATVILTGGIALLAFGGMAGLDARKSARFPDQYGPFVAHTSVLPFAALASGRVRLDWSKIGLWRPAAALAIYVVLLFAHEPVIGRSALPT
jgi:uncharacterized membrane protein